MRHAGFRTLTLGVAATLALSAALSTPSDSIDSSGPRLAGRLTAVSAPQTPIDEVGGRLVVAVGDIACAPGATVTRTRCRDAATAALTKAYDPERVLVLGDAQYDSGTLSEFQNGYAKTWGQFRSITRPVPGNHEYRTRGAAGYYAYFRNQQPGPPGFYALNVGRWRVYALNSNCGNVDCARQARWLDRDMTRRPRRCSAILLHHPLYSSGYEHGDSPQGRRFWQVALAHRAELALAGHDHNYERFHRMNADNQVTRRGLRSWVVGTGGKSLYHAESLRKGSAVFDNHAAGVLALKLGRTRYAWQYKTIDGRIVDEGIGRCR